MLYIELMKSAGSWEKIFVFAPYYPAIKHVERVLLVKQEVSNLKKEDFKNDK